MEKHFITALLVLILLAPQTGLEAKSRHHGVKERDHDAEERDHEDKNRYHKSKNRYHKSKKRHHKSKKHHHSSRKFIRFARGTKAELELLKQAISEINAKMIALEPQGQLPLDLEAKLDALQDAIDVNSGAIDTNSSDISLAMSDIEIIFMDIVKIAVNAGEIDGLKIAVTELGTRLDALVLRVDNHESRIAALENPPFVGVTFLGEFTKNAAPDGPTKTTWIEFRGMATGPFSSIEIKNNLNGSVKCSEEAVATGIANALKTWVPGAFTTFTCDSDGRIWNVGSFGEDAELNVGTTASFGNCGAQASVRPVISGTSGKNWGGIGKTCGAPTQTLEVLLER